jgi:tungstate transport system permease protein
VLSTLIEASQLLTALDAQLVAIVALSCRVSVTAVLLGAGLGMPLGAWLATAQFRGRSTMTVLLNACMGLPSVLVGVLVYLLLSRSGPLGNFGLLYSPVAMIIAQTILVVPLVAALSRQTIADTWRNDQRELRSLGLSRWQITTTLLYDCRHGLITVALAALGRALSEVGAVMIVGGNIEGFTRVMTTSIALETAKGDLPKSVALGMVLLAIVCSLNALVEASRSWAMRSSGY